MSPHDQSTNHNPQDIFPIFSTPKLQSIYLFLFNKTQSIKAPSLPPVGDGLGPWFPFQWLPWTYTVPKGSISIHPALQQVQISCGTERNEGLKGLLVHLVQHHRMWWVVLPHPGGTREINYCETVCILQVFSPVMTPGTAQAVGASLDRGILQCLKSWKYFPNTRTTPMPSLH